MDRPDLDRAAHASRRDAGAELDGRVEVIGLEEGPMPDKASFPAYWLYLGDTPVVHLDGLRVAYTTNEIPAFGLNQIFLVDPAGLRIELNFFSAAPTL